MQGVRGAFSGKRMFSPVIPGRPVLNFAPGQWTWPCCFSTMSFIRSIMNMLPMFPMRRFVESVFPALDRRCAVCGCLVPQTAQRHADNNCPTRVCAACRPDLKQRQGGFCPRCGLLFALETEAVSLCLGCRITPPPWREAYFFGAYAGLLKDLVLRFKFHAQLGLTLVLREMLVGALARDQGQSFDVIVPIPLHPKKLRARGFNQSLELARGLPESISCALGPQLLVRTRDTPAQHNLPRAQRLSNLRGAFQADPSGVRGKSVLLVDDILTTGATATAAAKALLAAGADNVNLAVIARA